MKIVRSSQVFTSVNSCTELSKTVFPCEYRLIDQRTVDYTLSAQKLDKTASSGIFLMSFTHDKIGTDGMIFSR